MGVLEAALERIANSDSGTLFDKTWIESECGCKGGDIRALRQSLIVLGITTENGELTDHGKLWISDDPDVNSKAILTSLKMIYPELIASINSIGDLSKKRFKDHIISSRGLSKATAECAALLLYKLLDNCKHQLKCTDLSAESLPTDRSTTLVEPIKVNRKDGLEVRKKALDVILGSLTVTIDANMNPDQMTCVFESTQRLVAGVCKGYENELYEDILKARVGVLKITIDGKWNKDQIDRIFDLLKWVIDSAITKNWKLPYKPSEQLTLDLDS